MTKLETESDDWGSWESQRERKQTLALAATPAERLAWLEQAILFAFQAGALPRDRGERT